MRTSWVCLAMALGFLLGFVGSVEAAVVSFGSGGNRFDMEFVTISNPEMPMTLYPRTLK